MPLAPSIENTVDHVALLVPNLGAAKSAFEAMGFVVSPRGHHATFKTSNHLILLDHSYIELLAVDEPRPENARHRAQLASGGGLRAVALPTDDVDETAGHMRAAGLEPGEVIAFDRPIGDGPSDGIARFRVLFLAASDPADAMLFFCEHLTPDLVWTTSCRDHPNGASDLEWVKLHSGQPASIAAQVAVALGKDANLVGHAVCKGSDWLEFASSERPSLKIGVRTLPAKQALTSAGLKILGQDASELRLAGEVLGDTTVELICL